jgi:YHS domain-containing protein
MNSMKQWIVILFLSFSSVIFSQSIDYNTKRGYVAEGFDVVAYFTESKPIEGKKDFTVTYNDVRFKFSKLENLKLFKSNPEKYIPQYDGYCAYALAVKGKKVSINPKTFEVRDGKLYLFYNKGKTNTLQFWLNEGAKELQLKADVNWQKFINN